MMNVKLIIYAKLVEMFRVSRVSTSLGILSRPKALPLDSLFRTLLIFIFVIPNFIWRVELLRAKLVMLYGVISERGKNLLSKMFI
jgi:hypothetical protein